MIAKDYTILRFYINRVYRDVEIEGKKETIEDEEINGENDEKMLDDYVEVILNRPSEKNDIQNIVYKHYPKEDYNFFDLSMAVTNEIESDQFKFWDEEEKVGFLFLNELINYISDQFINEAERLKIAISKSEKMAKSIRTIEEDMVFILIGSHNEIDNFYNNLDSNSINDLSGSSSVDNLFQHDFKIIDITSQARRMAATIYEKALKNIPPNERKSES
jgi:hypothetical protein